MEGTQFISLAQAIYTVIGIFLLVLGVLGIVGGIFSTRGKPGGSRLPERWLASSRFYRVAAVIYSNGEKRIFNFKQQFSAST
jgi:hypothetical protein